MRYVSASITRFGHRNLLKLQKNSPTIFVVGGVVGLGVTSVMAAIATRKIEPILEEHAKNRMIVSENVYHNQRDEQLEVVRIYADTAWELGKLYAPTLAVGTLSTVSVLHGHKILQARHIATMAAYTSLMDQYQAYRARVSETLGPEMEQDIYNGAVGKWEEDPDHKGEYKMKSKFTGAPENYLRPNWTTDPTSNFYFLKGAQAHMNNLLNARGYVFLFEVYDALGIPRAKETIVAGWLLDNDQGDGFVDFGFMASREPEAIMFRNGAERSVRLNFNIDGVIWDLI
jgi:Family of unknown function (DUF6353)